MRWIRDTLTAPGFYWNRGAGGRKRIVEVRDDGRGLFIVQTARAVGDAGEGRDRFPSRRRGL
jgi:hypothetical protein